ncbi:MAG: glycosyltransferase family 4 protein [Vicinamibacterales bacterium]
MRIGYTCHDAFPSTSTNTQQVFWTLFEMATLGHAVDLCVPAVRGGADAREVIGRHYGAPNGAVPDRLQFVALRSGRGNSVRDGSTLTRGWFDILAPARLVGHSHDVLWTRDPLALTAAVRRGIPAVFETYRPDYALASAFALWRRATLGAPTLVGVITHSRLAADAFVNAGVNRERVLVAHNGFAPALMQPRLSRLQARTLLGLPSDATLLVYTGHVGRHKGTDALITLAAAMPDAVMVIVGVDALSEDGRWLVACVARAGARNVLLRPRVDVRDVAPYLYAADCLIVPATDAPLRRYGRTVLPMKLFPYMASGTPIVAPRLPDVEEVLEHGRTALLVPPDDPPAAAAAVTALITDSARAERLGLAARDAARAFTWEARARKISERLEQWLR